MLLEQQAKQHTLHTKPNLALISNTKSDATLKAYQSDLSVFYYWANDQLPEKDEDGKDLVASMETIQEMFSCEQVTPELIVLWLEKQGFEYKISTIKRKISALSWMFKISKLDDKTKEPVVKESLLGLQRLHAQYIGGTLSKEQIAEIGLAPPKRNRKSMSKKPAPALKLKALLQVFDYINENEQQIGFKRAARDKCLLSLWWAGAFRRSEIANLQRRFVKLSEEGLTITMPISKTDQTGKGIAKGITYSDKYPELCPVKNYEHWLKLLNESNQGDYLFLKISHADEIADINEPLNVSTIVRTLKNHLKNAGIPDPGLFSGHSPRRGFTTDAYYAGASTRAIVKQGGWKNDKMVNDYIEEDSVFMRNATSAIL